MSILGDILGSILGGILGETRPIDAPAQPVWLDLAIVDLTPGFSIVDTSQTRALSNAPPRPSPPLKLANARDLDPVFSIAEEGPS